MIPLPRPALLERLLKLAGALTGAAREDSSAPLTGLGEWASPWLPPIARRSSL